MLLGRQFSPFQSQFLACPLRSHWDSNSDLCHRKGGFTIFQSHALFCWNREESLFSQGPGLPCPENSYCSLSLYTWPLKMLFPHFRLDQCLWHNSTACEASSTAKSVSLELPSWPLFTSILLQPTIALHPAALLQLTWCDTSNPWVSLPSPSMASFEIFHYLASSFQEDDRKKQEKICITKQ